MSWTNDEKRAALGLLSRIATGIETLIADTRQATDPEHLATVWEDAQRRADERRDAVLRDDSDDDDEEEPKEH